MVETLSDAQVGQDYREEIAIMSDIKVGQAVWIFQKYGRLYTKYHVVGETSRSWIVVPVSNMDSWVITGYPTDPKRFERYTQKIAKAGEMKGDWRVGTDEDARQTLWAVKNAYAISSRVSVADAPILIQIAKLIGFPCPEEDTCLKNS
jgi:hypothetical protein